MNATENLQQDDVECIKKAIGQSSSSGEHYMLSISEVQLVHSMTGYMRKVDIEDYFSVEKVDDEIQAIMEYELLRDAADIYDDDHDDHLDDDDAIDLYDLYDEPFNVLDLLYDTDTDDYDDDYILEAYRAYKMKLIHSRLEDDGAYPDDDDVGAYPDADDDDIWSIA